MESKFVMDYRFIVAFGVAVVGIIFATKMDAAAVKEVSIHAIDSAKEYAIAKSIC